MINQLVEGKTFVPQNVKWFEVNGLSTGQPQQPRAQNRQNFPQ